MRNFARLFLPFFAFWLVISPGVSYAAPITTFRLGSSFYPKTVGGVAGLGVDVIALAGRASPWITGLTLGYQIARWAVDGVRADSSVVPLDISASASAQVPPAGQTWTDWTMDSAGVWHPPSTISQTTGWKMTSDPATWSQVSAMDACTKAVHISYPTGWCVQGSATTGYLNYNFNQYNGSGQYVNGTASMNQQFCADGYTTSGGSCALSNESLVKYPSDGVPSAVVKADGTGFDLNPRDPDNVNAPATIPSPLVINGVANGQNTRVTVTPLTGGGFQVKTEQEVIYSDGTKGTFRQVVTVDNSSKVIDSSSGNYPGTIPQQTDQTAPTSPSTTTQLQLPTDYARQGEAGTAAQGIKDKLDIIHNDLKADEVPVPAQSLAAQAPGLDTALGNLENVPAQITAIPGGADPVAAPHLPQPFTPTDCQPLSWSFSPPGLGQQTIIYDICPKVAIIQRIASWFLYLLTAGLLFQMFTRRPEGGE